MIAAIVCRGFGFGVGVNYLPTLGYAYTTINTTPLIIVTPSGRQDTVTVTSLNS